jgi:nitronate monooxygenase
MNTLPTLLRTHLLLQAPMAGVQGSALALAVCAAGGMGSLPCAMLSPEALTAGAAGALARHRPALERQLLLPHAPAPDAAPRPRWRQALAPFYAEAGLDICRAGGAGRVPFSHDVADLVEPFRPPVVSFHFGLPAPELLARVKGWGSVVLSSATTVDEARWLEAHGATR